MQSVQIKQAPVSYSSRYQKTSTVNGSGVMRLSLGKKSDCKSHVSQAQAASSRAPHRNLWRATGAACNRPGRGWRGRRPRSVKRGPTAEGGDPGSPQPLRLARLLEKPWGLSGRLVRGTATRRQLPATHSGPISPVAGS